MAEARINRMLAEAESLKSRGYLPERVRNIPYSGFEATAEEVNEVMRRIGTRIIDVDDIEQLEKNWKVEVSGETVEIWDR